MSWYFMSLKINIFSIPPFITSLLTLFLGLFVYFKNRKEKQNITYLFLCLSISIWLYFASMLMSAVRDEKITTFLAKMVFVGVTFIPITFYHFVMSLLNVAEQKNNFIKISYIIGLIFMFFLFFTNLYISDAYEFFWGFYPKAGILHPLGILLFLTLYGGSLWALYKKAKSKDINFHQKNKLRYAFIAFFIAAFGAMDYIPNYGYSIYPVGYIFIFTFLLIFAYAILRHQLLDIEVVIKKTLIFAGLFTVVYAIFAFFALLGQIFFEKFVTQNRWVSMIPSVLVVTVMLRPLENFLVTVTDKYLFQKKYDYKELLKIFTSEVLTVLELDKLVSMTKAKLKEIMKIEDCDVIFEIASATSRPRNDTALKLPMTMKNETIGTLVLGRKKSDRDYTQEDLDILQPLAKALGIAISNAKLFEELSRTRAETAQKDKMATIGTLAAGMAHEIRNPITTIRNFADYLPDKYTDGEFISKFERLIPREIDRIESIARSLLEFSSSEDTGKKEKFALGEPVKTVIALLEPQYRASEIKIICNDKERHFVKGNRVQLQDAFFNILNYILAESRNGSSIVIECMADKGRPLMFIRNRDLFVREHIIKDVFEPVSGLYKEKRGFGFNLFVAKQLLERNEAVLKIVSDKINGSEFRIEFTNTSEQPS